MREMRFDNFKVETNGKISLELFATKTRKTAHYFVDQKVYKIIMNIKRQRSWMGKALEEIEKKLKGKLTNSEQSRLLEQRRLL